MSFAPLSRAALAARVAQDIPEGWYVNLGIGLPTLVADQVPLDREVVFQSENGVLGMGPAPAPGQESRWLVNAGKQFITLRLGGSYSAQSDSFGMIRGGHLDLAVLGAFEVAENGDLANWSISNAERAPAVGGAMDLAAGSRRVWVMMEHTTKTGAPRLVQRCTYPLTAAGVVDRIYTNLGIIDVTPEGFVVLEMVSGLSLAVMQEMTGAALRLADGA